MKTKLDLVREQVIKIEHEYSTKQIKHWWRKDSLSYMMGIAGHCSENRWDWNCIYYISGQIVLFKNHVFNEHDFAKADIYRLMRRLHIPFDGLMKIDYWRARQREKKYGRDDFFKTDTNIEARLYRIIRRFWYKVQCKLDKLKCRLDTLKVTITDHGSSKGYHVTGTKRPKVQQCR